jgi:hypothetical protein
MSEVKVNKISPRTNCGTVTLGDSGDSFTIPAGVTITNNGTQTGFGRTGTVNWQTTLKTANFTAVNGEGYFINTTSGAVTMTLPSSPSVGDIVAVKDYARTFDTNALTIARNGSNMDGAAGDSIFSTEGLSATLIYMDATKGWSLINDDATTQVGAQYVEASGGNTTATCGDFKIHTFTSPGTFTVTKSGNASGNNEIEYIVVGGGGSGSAKGPGDSGGGGGAGGFRYSSPSLAPVTYPAKPLTGTALNLPATGYPITVGAGGAGNPNPGGTCAPSGNGANGSNTIFSTITSTGGGRGGYDNPRQNGSGFPGGSGGGSGSGTGSGPTISAGTGNTPSVTPPQGNPGGTFSYAGSPPNGCAAAGGGALAAGSNSVGGNNQTTGGVGAGVPNAFGTSGENCGTNYYFAGGGGGGSRSPTTPIGGLGGGGNVSTAGSTNTGGGGGVAQGSPGSAAGNSGGSGIVIIRYKFQN